MLTAADARRRSFGLVVLMVAVAMVVWGQTLLKPFLLGLGFIFYWLACLLCVTIVMATALVDIWVIRRRIRRHREEMFKQALMEIELQTGRPMPCLEELEKREARSAWNPTASGRGQTNQEG
jgi:hypothetical protein